MKKGSAKKKALKRKKKVEKQVPTPLPVIYNPEEEKKKFLFHWNTLSWNAKYYIVVAQEFFAENNCSSYVGQLRKQMSTDQADLPIIKLMFYFISSPHILQMKEEKEGYVEQEDILVVNRCAYIMKIVGKKMLDPSVKEGTRFKWPNLQEPLSFPEILFFWFIFQYEIGKYFLGIEKQVYFHYSQEKQIRSTSHKSKSIRSSPPPLTLSAVAI